MKRLVKSLIPPLFMSKLNVARSYSKFFRYNEILGENKKLKNLHRGKRCFILGSGPSIKDESLKSLESEIVFALNNFYVHDDFQKIMKDKAPKYYMTAPIHPPQEEDEWRRWYSDMEKNIPKNVEMFFGLDSNVVNTKYVIERYNLFSSHILNWYFVGYSRGSIDEYLPLDLDISKFIMSANTVSVYALITAIYMGFDEIYLLGMDHNYFSFSSQDDCRFYLENFEST